MVLAGLGYLAAADPTALAGRVQAECLYGLEQAITSDYRSSEGSRCLGTSRCVGRSPESLSFTLSLAPGPPHFRWTIAGAGEPESGMTMVP
jgi:uncharacterized membrane protein